MFNLLDKLIWDVRFGFFDQSSFSPKISDFDALKWMNFRLRLSILDYSALLLRSIVAKLTT